MNSCHWTGGTCAVYFPQYTFDDAMDLIAKLPTLASIIYRNTYYDAKVEAIDPKKDWSANFSSMLGYTDPQFTGIHII